MFAIVPAAGNSTRMEIDGSKLLQEILPGVTVIEATLKSLNDSGSIQGFVIPCREEDQAKFREVCQKLNLQNFKVIDGGENRQESVFKALETLPEEAEHVLVHDAARPLCPSSMIRTVAKAGIENGASLLAVKANSTLKIVSESPKRVVRETIPRETMWEAQTPQVFATSLLIAAHQKAIKDSFDATDDCMLLERMGHVVNVVEGSPLNIKVTTKEDLQNAQLIAKGLSAKAHIAKSS